MKVLKFGGTSVGTVESLKNVRDIASRLEGRNVMVVSALGGLTDRLIAAAKMAAEGNDAYKAEMAGFRKRHEEIIHELVRPELKGEVDEKTSRLLDELERQYDGVALLRDLPDRTLDTIVSFGERISSIIVAGIVPGAKHYNSPDFVKTEKWYGKNIADTKLTTKLIQETLGQMQPQEIAVCGGFISTDRDTGEITNLGRGGSDYTAALIAAAMDAEVLEIWTDVDGFMTADPRIIPEAFVMDHMTFIESMQLCNFGAKVIYPPTIYPVFHKNIPIRILNTFRPDAPGTWIDDNADKDRNLVKGISALRNTALISLSGELAENVEAVDSRTYNAMAKKGINAYAVSSLSRNHHGFSFSVGAADLIEAMRTLIEEFSPELSGGQLTAIEPTIHLTTIACVGEEINSNPGLQAQLVNTLEREGIKVFATSGGSSATTITLLIDSSNTDQALKLIHASIFS